VISGILVQKILETDRSASHIAHFIGRGATRRRRKHPCIGEAN